MPSEKASTTKPKKPSSPTAVKKKPPKLEPPPPPPSDSESESESESASGSGSGSEESSSEEEEERPRKVNGTVSKGAQKPAAAAVQSTFQPPEPFLPISSADLPNTNPFSSKNLAGKEIWLITGPALAPLSKLTVVNPVDVAEGNAIMESQKLGRSYCLKPEEDVGQESIGVDLLVADSNGQYRIAPQPVNKTFRIVETLPAPPVAPSNHTPIPKPVRAQPEGLRMRFTAMGADIDAGGNDDLANGDAMEVDGNYGKSAAAVIDSAERKKRRRSGEGEKKKKKKKSRHDAMEE